MLGIFSNVNDTVCLFWMTNLFCKLVVPEIRIFAYFMTHVFLRSRVVLWRERSPPANVAWVRIPALCHIWVEFTVGSRLTTRVFFCVRAFPPSWKSNIFKFQFDQDRGRVWKPSGGVGMWISRVIVAKTLPNIGKKQFNNRGYNWKITSWIQALPSTLVGAKVSDFGRGAWRG